MKAYSDVTEAFVAQIAADRELIGFDIGDAAHAMRLSTNASEAEEAQDPGTTPERLSELADSGYFLVKMRVARHPSTPDGTLAALLASGDAEVANIAASEMIRRGLAAVDIDESTPSVQAKEAVKAFLTSFPIGTASIDIRVMGSTAGSVTIEKVGYGRFSVGQQPRLSTPAAVEAVYEAALPLVKEAFLQAEQSEPEL